MKPRYILIGLSAFAIGFALQSAFHVGEPASTGPKEVSHEAVEQYMRSIDSLGVAGINEFLDKTGRPAILYIYRSTDCDQCDAEWQELKPLAANTPTLVVSADDSRHELATKLASMGPSPGFLPYHIPSRRQLTVRTFLNDRGCAFDGTLPYVALTDGKGSCAMVWQGGIDGSMVASALNALEKNDSVASTLPTIQ